MEYRDLLVTVSRRCQGLHELKTLDELKKTFIDIVECHYHAYTTGKVLHRDISEENVMFYRDNEGIAVGLLSDFDNASRVDEQGDIIGSNMKQRTGTVPFMALDILKNVGTPVPHIYRHDLESFVYLLVWASVHFDLKNGTCHEFDPVLKCWDAKLPSEFGRAGNQKRDFWLTKDVTDSILDYFQPDFDPLKDQWIRPLRALFKKGFRTAEDAEDEGDNNDFDRKTLGGVVTFENFVRVLGQKPREWGPV
ncbi:hypothetical protein DFS33DRAFT_1262140 [Desarmillaria ectypa]|nr:hypothetical protein DFS33DRAFT_1262140 [Desarmillaria ectypa]